MRRRTNANVPAKGRLRDMADRLWALAVGHDWVDRCAVCGSPKIHAHHLVPRTHEGSRYALNNGIALCASHHLFDKDLSPHQNAAGWLAWLNQFHPTRANWYMDNRRPLFCETKNADYYCGVIRRLKQYVEPAEFESIVGVRFAAWLDENQVDEADAEE